ncbi:hypothetical protein, partial [Sinorhizobium meliloti]|uniref:hypothetical protein n=1 Tax=Rhizobium meliloti TaxID=382 RepID=UPI000FDA7471
SAVPSIPRAGTANHHHPIGSINTIGNILLEAMRPPLFLDSPDTADTAFPSSAHIDWFCWVAFDVLADPRYQMPPRSDGPPEFGAPNLTGQ